MQLDRPLDFYAVTDHGFYLGVVGAGADTSTEISTYAAMKSIHNLNAAENLTFESIPRRNFRAWIGGLRDAMAGSEPLRAEVARIMRSTWADSVQAADRHYEPGKFTTFAAYAFSSRGSWAGYSGTGLVFPDLGGSAWCPGFVIFKQPFKQPAREPLVQLYMPKLPNPALPRARGFTPSSPARNFVNGTMSPPTLADSRACMYTDRFSTVMTVQG